MLGQIPKFEDPNLLSQDIPFADAGIYRMKNGQVLVQSVDFFTPVVDDPFTYGQIAASNSLSDIYAVGAEPQTAMNIVGFPLCHLGADVLAEILQGGAERVREAGAVIVGGHSVEDDEPKYGLSVTGIADFKDLVMATDCQAGDQLILTKPLGTGLLATAIKGEVLVEAEIPEAIAGMVALNKTASRIMCEIGVNACTDITGFGLVGHACEMAEASKLGLRIDAANLPVYPRALEMAQMGLIPEGAYRNKDFYLPRVDGHEKISREQIDLFCDPQTSGGLLISVSRDKLELLQQRLQDAGILAAHVGEAINGNAGRLKVGR